MIDEYHGVGRKWDDNFNWDDTQVPVWSYFYTGFSLVISVIFSVNNFINIFVMYIFMNPSFSVMKIRFIDWVLRVITTVKETVPFSIYVCDFHTNNNTSLKMEKTEIVRQD